MNKQELLSSLRKKGFSEKILHAFSKVKRENFIFDSLKEKSYYDTALPIGQSQTISQPYTIATMLELLELKKSQKVLEIGSGCGYVLALLSELVGEKGNVFGVEVIRQLAESSKLNLQDYENIKIYNKNGTEGLSEESLFDRILISAACNEVPKKILNQLKENGILVAPIGSRYEQSLVKIKRQGNKFITKEKLPGFIFVPFIIE